MYHTVDSARDVVFFRSFVLSAQVEIRLSAQRRSIAEQCPSNRGNFAHCTLRDNVKQRRGLGARADYRVRSPLHTYPVGGHKVFTSRRFLLERKPGCTYALSKPGKKREREKGGERPMPRYS